MGAGEDRVIEAFEKVRKKFLFSDVKLHQSIELPEITILSCKGKIGSLIGRNGIIVAELSKELGNKVRIVEHSQNTKKTITDMIGNARLLGVNEIYSPEGKSVKVILHHADRKRLAAKPEHLEQALEKLTEAKTSIEFQ
ncbi:MAG: hypothetical protein NUV67_06350 [archaeon]|nr:hypothetical protein [archaeon]